MSLTISKPQHIISIVDSIGKPIEGIYVKQNNHFWYSDRNGNIKITEALKAKSDTLYFSHLSYLPEKFTLDDLKFINDTATIKLKNELVELKEIIVSNNFDAKKYVENAIKNIPNNYSDPFDTNLTLNTKLLYQNKDSSGYNKLIDYKGMIQLLKEKNNLYVIKDAEKEFISGDLKQNVFLMKPSDFVSIIPIQKHNIIRYYKSYKFKEFEHIEYKGQKVLKIYYQNKKRNGFLIIEDDTKAILFISHSVEATNNWTIGTMKKRGLVTTGIESYHTEAEYIKNTSGKYPFDSGQESVSSFSKWGTNLVYLTYDVYLKRLPENGTLSTNKKHKIKDLF